MSVLRITGISLSLLSIVLSAPVTAQSSPRVARKAVLIMKDSFSTAGISAFIRRAPGGENVLVFKRAEFTPELLGLALLQLNALVDANPTVDTKTDTPLRSDAPTPSLDAKWSGAVTRLASNLQRAPRSVVPGIGMSASVRITVPPSPPCNQCRNANR